MNKIIENHPIEVETKEFTIGGEKYLEWNEEQKEIHYRILVEKNATCHFVFVGNHVNLNLEILQKEGSKVQFSSFLENSNSKVLIKLKEENAEMRYAYSALASEDSKNQISVVHEALKTKSEVYCNGFSKNHANILFDVSGIVEKESTNCSCLQDSKIIEENPSLSQINPKLYIENYEVEASHSAYLGPFLEQDLFYLESRGIPRQEAMKLLGKALLLGKLNLEESKKGELIQRIEKQQE